MIRVCRICGKKFEYTKYNRWYCSDECKSIKKISITYNKVCEICGEGFETGKENQKKCKECIEAIKKPKQKKEKKQEVYIKKTKTKEREEAGSLYKKIYFNAV